MTSTAGDRLVRACSRSNIKIVERLLFEYFFSNRVLDNAAAKAITKDNIEILDILVAAGWNIQKYIAKHGLPVYDTSSILTLKTDATGRLTHPRDAWNSFCRMVPIPIYLCRTTFYQ
jgi:hypothetical protein